MLTLKGSIKGREFVDEDGVCYPLKYYLGERENVFINCLFNENGTLSVYRIFEELKAG